MFKKQDQTKSGGFVCL